MCAKKVCKSLWKKKGLKKKGREKKKKKKSWKVEQEGRTKTKTKEVDSNNIWTTTNPTSGHNITYLSHTFSPSCLFSLRTKRSPSHKTTYCKVPVLYTVMAVAATCFDIFPSLKKLR